MHILGSDHLFITITTLCCLLLSSTGSSITDQVCRNVKDYQFCKGIINSEPNLPPTDPINAAYAAFRMASNKVGHVLHEIKAEIERVVGHGGGNPSILKGLNNCLKCYTRATESMREAMGDLDSESYQGLAELSTDARSNVTACCKGYRSNSHISIENAYMIKVVDVCGAVALLF